MCSYHFVRCTRVTTSARTAGLHGLQLSSGRQHQRSDGKPRGRPWAPHEIRGPFRRVAPPAVSSPASLFRFPSITQGCALRRSPRALRLHTPGHHDNKGPRALLAFIFAPSSFIPEVWKSYERLKYTGVLCRAPSVAGRRQLADSFLVSSLEMPVLKMLSTRNRKQESKAFLSKPCSGWLRKTCPKDAYVIVSEREVCTNLQKGSTVCPASLQPESC